MGEEIGKGGDMVIFSIGRLIVSFILKSKFCMRWFKVVCLVVIQQTNPAFISCVFFFFSLIFELINTFSNPIVMFFSRKYVTV